MDKPPAPRRVGPPPLPSGRAIPRMPPPPSRPDGTSPPPLPAVGASPKDAATVALRLRDEQLQAQVQYYNAGLATNAELDAITAEVVAGLRSMSGGRSTTVRRADVERELTQNLRGLLEKLFSPQRSGFLVRKLEDVQRRISQLFFQSALYAELAEGGREVPAASWPEQALYFVLKRHEETLLAELSALPVDAPEVRDRAVERLHAFERQLCSAFLSKTTPELETLLEVYRTALTRFLREVFPRDLDAFSGEVIRGSDVATGHEMGHKLTIEQFARFRATFDRAFLERLAADVQSSIVRTVSADGGRFREATLRFVSDPRIHSEICAAVNDALFDYLHGEGFLDLPTDWRRLLTAR